VEGSLLGLRTGAVTLLAINIPASFGRFAGLVFEGVVFPKNELGFFERAALCTELAFFERLVSLRLIIGQISAGILGWRAASLVPRPTVKETR